MTRVAIEGLKFYAYHGFYDPEQLTGRHFEIDVFVDIIDFDSIDDNIKDTVNYERIYEICKSFMDQKYRLLETVALLISKEIKAKYDHVHKVKVRIAKLHPPLPAIVRKVYVEHEI